MMVTVMVMVMMVTVMMMMMMMMMMTMRLGRFDIEGWCSYPGSLCTWNLNRRELNPERADTTIETDSCLMCCAFHPKHPVRLPCCYAPSGLCFAILIGL